MEIVLKITYIVCLIISPDLETIFNSLIDNENEMDCIICFFNFPLLKL